MTAKSLGQTTATGAVWLLGQNVVGRLVGFLSQLVVAAVLLPEDFGVIGLAYTVSTFGSILTNFGVDSVLLQRQGTMRLWVVPAFWYSLGLGLTGFLVVLALGPLAAHLYAQPSVAGLAAIIGVGIPITVLGTIPTVTLRAQFRFRAIASINLAEILLIQGLTIAFAVMGMGAYSFALPLPVVAVLRTVLVWGMTSPDMSGLFNRFGRIKYLMNSSTAVFGTGVVQSAIAQGDYIVLGLMGDAASVGVYFFAFKMASQPLLMMAMSLSSVLFPALSHLRNAPAAQNDAAFRAAKLLGLLIMPIAFLQSALVEPAIHLFFVSKWDASIPLMQILSIALGFDGIAWVAASLITARRGFRQQFLYVTAFAPPFFIMVMIGGWHGSALGVALGVAAYYILVTPIYSYVVFRQSGVGFLALISLYLFPAAISALAVGGAVLLARAAGLDGNLGRILVVSVLSGLIYGGLLRLLDPRGFGEVVQIALKMANRVPKPPARLA